MPDIRSIQPARWVRASTMSVTTSPTASAAAPGRPGSSSDRPFGPVTAKSTPWSARPDNHSTRAWLLVTVAGNAGLSTASSGVQAPRTTLARTSRPVQAPSRASTPAVTRRTLNLKLSLRRAWPSPARARPVAAAQATAPGISVPAGQSVIRGGRPLACRAATRAAARKPASRQKACRRRPAGTKNSAARASAGYSGPAGAKLQQLQQAGRGQRQADLGQHPPAEQPAAPGQQQQQRQPQAAGEVDRLADRRPPPRPVRADQATTIAPA